MSVPCHKGPNPTYCSTWMNALFAEISVRASAKSACKSPRSNSAVLSQATPTLEAYVNKGLEQHKGLKFVLLSPAASYFTVTTCSCNISSCKLTIRLLSQTYLEIMLRETKPLAANIKNKNLLTLTVPSTMALFLLFSEQ